MTPRVVHFWVQQKKSSPRLLRSPGLFWGFGWILGGGRSWWGERWGDGGDVPVGRKWMEMDGSIVSENSGTPKIIHFNRVFHYKPSILGYHYFWKHPYGDGINRLSWPILIVCDILGLFHLLRNEDILGTLGLFHLLINGDTLGWHNPLILTLDPNFLKHPSTLVHSGFWQSFWCDGKYYTPWNEHLRTWKWLVGNYWEILRNDY